MSLTCMHMRGGIVKRGHNDLRDSEVRLVDFRLDREAVYLHVQPVVVEENDRCGRPRLQADRMAMGVGSLRQPCSVL